MSDFTWTPSYDTEVEDSYTTRRAKLGDGYELSAPSGINPARESWTLVFDNIPRATSEEIRDFLRSKVGQGFTWTNPEGVEKRYECPDGARFRRNGPNTVSGGCVFNERIEP